MTFSMRRSLLSNSSAFLSLLVIPSTNAAPALTLISSGWKRLFSRVSAMSGLYVREARPVRDQDAVLAQPALRPVEEREAPRVGRAEGEDGQRAPERVVDLARPEPPLGEHEDIGPTEEASLGEGALEGREVDALERPILVSRERTGEPGWSVLQPAGRDMAGDCRHEDQGEDSRGDEAPSIDGAPLRDGAMYRVAQRQEEQEIAWHAPVEVALTGRRVGGHGGGEDDRHDGEARDEPALGGRFPAERPP